MSAEGRINSDYSKPDEQNVDRVQIVGTPYWSIGIKKSEDTWEYHLVLGQNRLNEIPLETHEGVLAYLETNRWDIIMKTIMIVTAKTVELSVREADKQIIEWMDATRKPMNKKQSRN